MTKFTSMIVVNLATPKAAAKQKLSFKYISLTMDKLEVGLLNI